MRITEVKVFIVNQGPLKAYAEIIIEGCFVVKSLKLIYSKDRYFVAMPSYKNREGIFKDIAYPINDKTRQLIEYEILKAYEEKLNSIIDPEEE